MDVKTTKTDTILEKDKKIAELKRQIEKTDKDKRFREEKNLEIECKVKYVASKLPEEASQEPFLGKRPVFDFDEEFSLRSQGDSQGLPNFPKAAGQQTDNKLLLKKESRYLKSKLQLLKGLLDWRHDQDNYLYKRSSELILSSKATSSGVLEQLRDTFGLSG